MTGETLFVLGLLAATVALFASDRLRMDVVALLVILSLMLSGVLTPREALAGFGDPLVVLIAGLFVVGEALVRTGIAFTVGGWLVRVAGTGELRLLTLLMGAVAVVSAFMSNTGAVAIFIPVALTLARKAGVPAARVLLPLALAASIGGMLTLIGTPPNLAVSTELSRAGLAPFGFFSFTPVGLLILAAAVAYVVLLGRRLLPGPGTATAEPDGRLSLAELIRAYALEDRLHRLRVERGSPLCGQTVGQALLRTRFGVTVLAVERARPGRARITPVLLQTEYRAGDVLYLAARPARIGALLDGVEGLTPLRLEAGHGKLLAHELGLAEVLLTPRSALIGRSIGEARFRERYGLSALGILRMGKPVDGPLLETRLQFGDSLLVGGGWRQIELLQADKKDLTVLSLPLEMDEVAPARARAPVALAVVAAMLVLMTLGLVPAVAAVLLAVAGMLLGRCVGVEEAYRAVNWQSVVLIAGMLPMAGALDKTGALDLLVGGLVASLGGHGPFALMTGLFVLTSTLSQFISNTATTVLVAPVALGAASTLAVSPYPLLMTVALAASTAFSTPMASPVNTLVVGPGGYRFNDFVRIGVPLQLLALAITLAAVPLLFPF